MNNNKLFLILLVSLAFLKGAWAQNTYIECSWDTENKTVVQTPRAIPLDANTINSSMNSFAGWNVVMGNVTINNNVRCMGHVKLILCDGAELTITGGLTVHREMDAVDSLTIYCQSYGSQMGKLTVTCDIDCYAGIGGAIYGSRKTLNGPITIHGGDINTTGGSNMVGMGCRHEDYYGYAASPITIYGGRVEAHGGEIGGTSVDYGCAGIGLIGLSGATLNVYGGNVYAYGANEAAGIGGCSGYLYGRTSGNGGTVNVYGGYVEAHGGKYGAGIGGGQNGNGGSLTVHGGTVYAYAGTDAAGIGSGEQKEGTKNGGTLTVTGGTVYAHGGNYGAGIGGGQDASGATVIISGGHTYAYSGTDAAGVGSGEEVSAGEGAINGGSLTVTGGYLYADGTDVGCGIGGGQDADGADVIITGGTVVAWCGSGSNTSAIGSNLEGTEHYGTLYIGDNMMVHAGNNPTEAMSHLFPADTRKPACWYRDCAVIEVCNHPNGTNYSDNGSSLNVGCNHCLAKEPYTFQSEGNWNVASHWLGNFRPDDGNKTGNDVAVKAAATIPASCIANVGNIDLQEGGSLTIADGGQLIHTNEEIVAMVEKNIAAYSGNGYYLLTNPVQDTLLPVNLGMTTGTTCMGSTSPKNSNGGTTSNNLSIWRTALDIFMPTTRSRS